MYTGNEFFTQCNGCLRHILHDSKRKAVLRYEVFMTERFTLKTAEKGVLQYKM
ncbi:MAG: hypothetical protein GX996_04500 [Firmicutes bacterium]|nr:hypothetical protein [Bacillota bacterium]